MAMVCNLPTEALTALAASPQMPFAVETEAEDCKPRRSRPAGVTDILTIGATPTLAAYLSGLFQQFGWTLHLSVSCESAVEFLGTNKAAVAICEEALPDAGWQAAARILNSVPHAPMFVVIGSDKPLLDEVLAIGGFDVLTRPLREAEVIWTVASAWHQWMNRLSC
jgi:DNA-binding NtrC family response regulator